MAKKLLLYFILIFSISALIIGGAYFYKNKKAQNIPQSKQAEYACPSVKEFCQTGGDVYLSGTYIGFGGKIATGSAIKAAFDGEITASKITPPNPSRASKTQEIVYVFLANPDKALRAAYYFSGDVPERRNVKKGEVFATSSAQPILLYSNNSLVFILTKNDPDMKYSPRLGGERVQLKPVDFE